MFKSKPIVSGLLIVSIGAGCPLAAVAQPQPVSQPRAAAVAVSPQTYRAQVAAATANALNQLKSDVSAVRMTPGMTVAQYLDSVDATDQLDQLVRRAQQIGGPRWVDDQTCQVKLELSGAQVVYWIVSLAAVKQRATPIPAAALEQRLADLKQQTFTATGTSISAERVQMMRPVGVGQASEWMSISDAARSQAVTAARQDAAQRVVDSIRNVPLEGGGTVGDLLARDSVQRAVNDWLSTRPVTGLKFKEDLQVELTLAAPPDDLLDTVVSAARSGPGGADVKIDEKGLETLRAEFARRVTGVGRAGANKPAPSTAPAPAAITLPDQAPQWLGQLIDAEGRADGPYLDMKTKFAAEKNATENLRRRVMALQITPDMSIDTATRLDPRFAEAVNRAMLRATVSKTDWRTDGVLTRMILDPRDVWYELSIAARE